MKADDASLLLDRFDTLRHPCDLDLLIFFVKHPSTLIASEVLAAFMGYELRQVALSLDVLIDAGLVTRSQPRTQVARMYIFCGTGSLGGWLPALVALASTRTGRLALMGALKSRPPGRPRLSESNSGTEPLGRSLRPILVSPIVDRLTASTSGRPWRGGK